MRSGHPLWSWLALRIVLASVLPLTVVAALSIAVFLPQLRAEREARAQLSALATAASVGAHLQEAERLLRSVADEVRQYDLRPESLPSARLDALVGNGDPYAAIVLANGDGSVAAAGLPPAQLGARDALLHGNVSARVAAREARWSLASSAISAGQPAVALAIPAGDGFLVGELTADRFTEFLARLVTGSTTLVLIVDRQGRVVACSALAVPAASIRQIAPLRLEAVGKPAKLASASFEFDGRTFAGFSVALPQAAEWNVLVAEPKDLLAPAPAATSWVLEAGGFAALLLTIVVALALARSLARMIAHCAARAGANGDERREAKKLDIRELDELAQHLEQMSLAARRRERDLAASEARFRSVISNVPLVLFQFDENGIFTFSEGKALARVGRQPGEAVGQSIFDLYGDHPDVVGYARRAMRGEAVQFSTQIGEARFDVHFTPVRGGDGRLQVLGVSVDVTERWRAEEALRESEAQLRTAIESVPFDFFLIGTSGRYVLQNSVSRKAWGNVVGKLPEEVTDDAATLACWLDNNRRALAGEVVEAEVGFFVGNEERCIRNIIAPVRDGEQIRGIVGLNIDITEYKRAERALLQSETKYRRLHESMRDATVLVDMSGVIQEFNHAYLEMLGYSEDELRRLTYVDLTPARWHSYEAAIVDEQIVVSGYSEVYEKEYRRKDGSVFPVELRTFLIRDDAGQPAAMWAIVRDITERKHAEEALRRANRQLRMVSESNQALIHLASESELLAAVCAVAIEIGGYRMAWVGYAEDDDARSVTPMAHAGCDEGYLQKLRAFWAEADNGRGPVGRAIRSGRACTAQDIESDPTMAPWHVAAREHGYAAVCALPLRAGGRTFGAFTVYSADAGAFDSDEIGLLSALASDLAFGISALRTRSEKERAAQALKESEFFLRRSQEVGDLGSYYLDARTGVWIRSERLDHILGIDDSFPKTVDGWRALIHPDDRQETLAYLTEHVLARSNRFDRQYRIVRHNDGEERWVHGLGELEFADDGVPIKMIGTIQDITQSKRADQALAESEARYRLLFDANPHPMWVYDVETLAFLTVNDAAIAKYGYSREQFLQMTIRDIRPGEDVPLMLEKISTQESGMNYAGFWRHRKKDGQIIEVEIISHLLSLQGRPAKLVLANDITERRRAERALHESEERLQQAIRVAHLGIFDHDHLADVIYWSPEQRRIHDWEAEEPVTLANFVASVHPEDRARITTAIERAHDPAGDGIYDVEHRIVHRNGDVRWIVTRSQTTFVGQGEARRKLRTVGADIDVTDRKRQEAELQRYREQLEELVAERTDELRQAMSQLVQAEKLAALGHLVAGIAHELNTPLGNARVVASALGEDLRAFATELTAGTLRRSQVDVFVGRGREAVDLLERNAARAADLIGHFKQVAVDQTSIRRRRFALYQTIEELLATLRPQFKHTAHRVELDVPVEIELDSYPGPLEQVIANLVGNSLTHGFADRDSGCIRLQARAIEPAHVILRYSDDGIGIPAAAIKRIFEPFFTTRLGQGSSGLGLYIVYNLVTGVLGGSIEVASSPGEGATFTLTLPRCAPERSSPT